MSCLCGQAGAIPTRLTWPGRCPGPCDPTVHYSSTLEPQDREGRKKKRIASTIHLLRTESMANRHDRVYPYARVAQATRCGCRTGESPAVCRTMSCISNKQKPRQVLVHPACGNDKDPYFSRMMLGPLGQSVGCEAVRTLQRGKHNGNALGGGQLDSPVHVKSKASSDLSSQRG